MTAAKLAVIVEQLGGKHIASVTIRTLSGERFEFLSLMAHATPVERVLMDEGGAVVLRSFDVMVDGATVTIEHVRAANLAELREAL